MGRFFTFCILFGFLFLYYFICYKAFSASKPPNEFPVLKERLGTILFHSNDKDGIFEGSLNSPDAVEHNYCFYPKGSTTYKNKGSEYIIKREDNGDCSGWFGQVTFVEGSWVSEREKLWWSGQQYAQEVNSR